MIPVNYAHFKSIHTTQEPILQNVTLYRIDNSASEVPLFMLKADSVTFQAICYRNSTAQQLMSFSLAICRTIGYDALQRYDTFSYEMNVKECY